MDPKVERRQKLKWRIRKKISGTSSCPRLSVFRSNKEIYAQLIDDSTGVTLVASNSRGKDVESKRPSHLCYTKHLHKSSSECS